MIKAVFLSRKSDGFFLCEYSNPNISDYRDLRAKIKSFYRTEESRQGEHEFLSLEGGNYLLMLNQGGVTFSIVSSRDYPKKLSKAFAMELSSYFRRVLESEYGSSGVDYRSKIETIDEPYYFLKFDKQISKVIKKFEDVDSNENIERINNDLYSIQNAVSESLQLLMDKDKKVKDMQYTANEIRESSGKFKNKAKEVRLTLQLRKYMLFAIIGVLAIIFIYLKFF